MDLAKLKPIASDPECVPCNGVLTCPAVWDLAPDRVYIRSYVETDPEVLARIPVPEDETLGWIPRDKARAMLAEALRALETQ
jgi:hypothetical protein